MTRVIVGRHVQHHGFAVFEGVDRVHDEARTHFEAANYFARGLIDDVQDHPGIGAPVQGSGEAAAPDKPGRVRAQGGFREDDVSFGHTKSVNIGRVVSGNPGQPFPPPSALGRTVEIVSGRASGRTRLDVVVDNIAVRIAVAVRGGRSRPVTVHCVTGAVSDLKVILPDERAEGLQGGKIETYGDRAAVGKSDMLAGDALDGDTGIDVRCLRVRRTFGSRFSGQWRCAGEGRSAETALTALEFKTATLNVAVRVGHPAFPERKAMEHGEAIEVVIEKVAAGFEFSRPIPHQRTDQPRREFPCRGQRTDAHLRLQRLKAHGVSWRRWDFWIGVLCHNGSPRISASVQNENTATTRNSLELRSAVIPSRYRYKAENRTNFDAT